MLYENFDRCLCFYPFTGIIRIRFDQRCGPKRTARIDLWFARQVTGFSFDIGDSPTVNGYGNRLFLFLCWQQQYDHLRLRILKINSTYLSQHPLFLSADTMHHPKYFREYKVGTFFISSFILFNLNIFKTVTPMHNTVYVIKVEMLGQLRMLQRCMGKKETCSYIPTIYLAIKTTPPTVTCRLKTKPRP